MKLLITDMLDAMIEALNEEQNRVRTQRRRMLDNLRSDYGQFRSRETRQASEVLGCR
jgi:hypothetical protein